MFEPVAARYDGPELEKGIVEFWRRENVFGRIMAEGAARPKFVFYEGPPTANGRPGIHHVLARTFKDLYPRYKTMRGFHCPRKAGWDTHGLPVEHEIEKELGIFDKRRIEQEVGIAQFTAQCRASVMRHVAEWEAMTERMGFWVDFEDAYFTLHNDYIESVWHLLKQIFDKGLIYQGYKVVPYDPRIGATLSSHEVAQGYREVEDPSVYVRFRVQGEAEHLLSRLDDDPLDVAGQPAARRPSRRRIRLGEARQRDADSRRSRSSPASSRTRTSRSSAARSAASSTACVTSACSTICRRRARSAVCGRPSS